MGIDHAKLLSIKSGGQSLSQLTAFCRELQRKGITDELSDEDLGKSSDEEDFHHPFMVKDKPLPAPMAFPGSSLTPAGLALESSINPTMKAAAKSHRMLEFPVSSGNAHRVKEADLPEEEPAPAAAPLQLEMKPPEEKPEKTEEEPVEEPKEKPPSAAEIANAQNPLGVLMFGGQKEPEPPLALEGPKETPSAPETAPAPAEPVPAASSTTDETSQGKSDQVWQLELIRKIEV